MEEPTEPESPLNGSPATESPKPIEPDPVTVKEAAVERSRAKLSEATEIPEEDQQELEQWALEEEDEPIVRSHHHVPTEAEAQAQAELFPSDPPGEGIYGEPSVDLELAKLEPEIARWRSKCREGRQTVGHVANYAHMALDSIKAQKHGIHVLEKHFEIPQEAIDKGFTWIVSQRVTQDTAEAMFDSLAAYVPTE